MGKFKFFCLCDLLIIFWFEVAKVDCIVSGQDAVIGQFPYTVSVQANNQHVCGGTVVGEKHVLTAAHCVINLENNFINNIFSIRGGIINLNAEQSYEVRRYVVKIYIPDEYKRADHREIVDFFSEIGDLAMLELEEGLPLGSIALNKAILPVRKWGKIFPTFYNENVNVTGFGSDDNTYSTSGSNIIERVNESTLKYIKSQVMHKTTCKFASDIPISDKHICAQVKRTNNQLVGGPCNGDSGGPLMIDNTIIGVLAQHRYNCNENYGGSIYTRVSSYVPFINRVLRQVYVLDSRSAYFERTDTNDESNRAGTWIEIKPIF